MSEKKRTGGELPHGGGKQPRKDQPSVEKQAEPAAMAFDSGAAGPDGSPASGQVAPAPQHTQAKPPHATICRDEEAERVICLVRRAAGSALLA